MELYCNESFIIGSGVEVDHFQFVRIIGSVEHRDLSSNILYHEYSFMPVFDSVTASNSQSNASFHFIKVLLLDIKRFNKY
jgi:hypothetical protein